MPASPTGLLQDADGGPTALAIVVVLTLVAIGYFVARAAFDRIQGTYSDSATYQLVRGPDDRLSLDPVDDPVDGDAVAFDEEAMRALVDVVERRNEMRLHTILLADGTELAFEHWTPDEGHPRAILLEDSNGLVQISLAGLVEAEPPLDAAVRNDLLDVFEGLLSTTAER